MFEKFWQFSSFMVQKGFKILEVGTDEKFLDVNMETIKKYILIQLYRTPHNMRSYTNPFKNCFEMSQFNIAENETKEEFWKREMLTILDNDWDILVQSEMIGIRRYAMEINASFIMIIKTKEEFCINDIGYVAERHPINIPKEQEMDYIASVKKIGKLLYEQDNFGELARLEIDNQSNYLDNFI